MAAHENELINLITQNFKYKNKTFSINELEKWTQFKKELKLYNYKSEKTSLDTNRQNTIL